MRTLVGAPACRAARPARLRRDVPVPALATSPARRPPLARQPLAGRRPRRRDVSVPALAASAPPALPLLTAVAPLLSALRAAETALFSAVSGVTLALISAVSRLALDPWSPSDVWFVIVWLASVAPALRLLHRLAQRWSGAGAGAGAAPAEFERSSWGRLVSPLTQLGWCFAALWAFANGLALCEALGLVSDEPAAFVTGFPLAVYTAWAGCLALDVQRVVFARVNLGPLGNRLMLERAAGLVTILVTCVVAANFIGVHARALLAFGGLAGFASGLAIKDLLTNLFGGLSLLVQQPFLLGDKVSFRGYKDVVVAKLGYLQTVLRLSDSSLLYVPNGAFIASEVQNHSRSQLTRVAGSFCLRFRDAPNLATLLPALDGALRELPQFDGPPGGGPVARCAGFDGPGPVVRVEARFRRGPLGGDEVTSAAWLAVGRVVRDQGCGFAEAAAAAHGGGGAHGAGAAPAR